MKKSDNLYKVASAVAPMTGYVPGEQPSTSDWVKLNTNEFPYAPTPKIKAAVLKELGADCASLRLYPNPESKSLRQAVAEYYNVGIENVVAGNGSDDILNLIIRAFSDKTLKICSMNPSYSLYPVLAQIQGTKFEEFSFEKGMKLPFKKIFESGANVFFLTNPNAPTAFGFDKKNVEKLAKGFKGLLVIDEAYAPFADYNSADLALKYENVIVVGTSSKGFGLAGMRVGWGIASKNIIDIIDRVRDSYNIDRLAQVAAVAALKDKAYYKKMCGRVIKTRADIEKFFDSISWGYYKSSANFVFAKPALKGKSGAIIALNFYEFLRDEKILVRYWAKDSSINDYVRITIGTPDQMKKFKESVKKWINQESQK